MDKYRQFIEDMRRSRPQMPHPEEVTARIAEHTGAMPQDTTARPAPLRTGRIRLAAALTGIAAAASLVLTLSQALSSELLADTVLTDTANYRYRLDAIPQPRPAP